MCQATRSSIARVTGRSFPPVPRLAATATIVGFCSRGQLRGSAGAAAPGGGGQRSRGLPPSRTRGNCLAMRRVHLPSMGAAPGLHIWPCPPAATAQRGDSLRLKSQRPLPPPLLLLLLLLLLRDQTLAHISLVPAPTHSHMIHRNGIPRRKEDVNASVLCHPCPRRRLGRLRRHDGRTGHDGAQHPRCG